MDEAKLRHMWRQMRPLQNAGYTLMPLKADRSPRDVGYPSSPAYENFDGLGYLRTGGAVGVRLGPEDLVIDIDPRNGGDESFRRLVSELALFHLDDGVPKVRSGGGGIHLYFRRPAGLRTFVNLEGYSGIDFKRCVGYVVAPGSIHPKTGKLYTWAPDTAPPDAAKPVPEELLDLLRMPERRPRVRADSGVLTADELATVLRVVDARDYRDYSDWIAISAACHDATNGEGFEEWADWCRSDPEYADVATELLDYKWESFTAGRRGGTTYRTLFHALVKAGRIDLLRNLAAVEDFRDEMDAAPVDDRRPKE